MKTPSNIKTILYQKCMDHVEQRIDHAKQVLQDVTEAGNDETKSSAGDKHETARAMAQLEQEKALKQLSEAMEMKNLLLKVNQQSQAAVIAAGNLVVTDNGLFYIAVGIGKLMIDAEPVFAISAAAPLAVKLMNGRVGQQVEMNGQTYKILEVQ